MISSSLWNCCHDEIFLNWFIHHFCTTCIFFMNHEWVVSVWWAILNWNEFRENITVSVKFIQIVLTITLFFVDCFSMLCHRLSVVTDYYCSFMFDVSFSIIFSSSLWFSSYKSSFVDDWAQKLQSGQELTRPLVLYVNGCFYWVRFGTLSKVIYVEVVVIVALVCHTTGELSVEWIPINGGDHPLTRCSKDASVPTITKAWDVSTKVAETQLS